MPVIHSHNEIGGDPQYPCATSGMCSVGCATSSRGWALELVLIYRIVWSLFLVSFPSSLVASVPCGLGHVEQASLFVCFPSNIALRSLSFRELSLDG